MVSQRRTKTRTTNGQGAAQNARRTDTDSTIELSCLSGDASKEIEALDLVAFDMETNWGDNLLDHISGEWREKFEKQRTRLNALIEDGADKKEIANAAVSMKRGWWKIDALIRETGIKPETEAVWIVQHPKCGACAVYSGSAALGDIPANMPRFHIDEIVKLIPQSLFKVKDYWPESTIYQVNSKEDFNDDIPF
jgi:hypothetical protein